VVAGDRVKVRQAGETVLEVMLDAGLPDGVVRVAAAHPATAALGAMSGAIMVEKA
jgi:NADH-quinone oxidoreductase subunit G